jgi:hypothetical protein
MKQRGVDHVFSIGGWAGKQKPCFRELE